MEQPALEVAIDQATEALSKFSIPLYRPDRSGRPALRGTGFFVKAGTHHFLVSAAHVLDAAKSDGLYYYSAPSTVRRLSGQLVRSTGENRRDEDLIDVGVLRLSRDSVPPYPEVDKYAMDISYLRPQYRPRTGKTYVFIGFPATKTTVDHSRKEVRVTGYAFRNEPIEESTYSVHGLDPEKHIALSLDLKRGFAPDGAKQHFPKPNGMSGSPIVVLLDDNRDDSSDVFPVVGVATTYRKSRRLVFGTDVRYVLDAMAHAA